MGAARGMFDAAKHPRGSHGHFGSGGGVARRTTTFRAENTQPRYIPGRAAATERARKLAIKQRTEVARGVRPPATFQERLSLEWAAPRKIAEQRAKTGDARRPRLGPEGALHTARQAAGGFGRSNAIGTQGTRNTFTGKTIRARSGEPVVGMRGGKLTSRGRFNNRD